MNSVYTDLFNLDINTFLQNIIDFYNDDYEMITISIYKYIERNNLSPEQIATIIDQFDLKNYNVRRYFEELAKKIIFKHVTYSERIIKNLKVNRTLFIYVAAKYAGIKHYLDDIQSLSQKEMKQYIRYYDLQPEDFVYIYDRIDFDFQILNYYLKYGRETTRVDVPLTLISHYEKYLNANQIAELYNTYYEVLKCKKNPIDKNRIVYLYNLFGLQGLDMNNENLYKILCLNENDFNKLVNLIKPKDKNFSYNELETFILSYIMNKNDLINTIRIVSNETTEESLMLKKETEIMEIISIQKLLTDENILKIFKAPEIYNDEISYQDVLSIYNKIRFYDNEQQKVKYLFALKNPDRYDDEYEAFYRYLNYSKEEIKRMSKIAEFIIYRLYNYLQMKELNKCFDTTMCSYLNYLLKTNKDFKKFVLSNEKYSEGFNEKNISNRDDFQTIIDYFNNMFKKNSSKNAYQLLFKYYEQGVLENDLEYDEYYKRLEVIRDNNVCIVPNSLYSFFETKGIHLKGSYIHNCIIHTKQSNQSLDELFYNLSKYRFYLVDSRWTKFLKSYFPKYSTLSLSQILIDLLDSYTKKIKAKGEPAMFYLSKNSSSFTKKLLVNALLIKLLNNEEIDEFKPFFDSSLIINGMIGNGWYIVVLSDKRVLYNCCNSILCYEDMQKNMGKLFSEEKAIDIILSKKI